MRIVGGEFRGRSLAVPKSNAIRPTADRTRESLFNILSHAYPEAIDATRMMDLFAGTGAVGLEGASRGCRHVLFVESSVEGRGLLWENIDALSLHGRTRMLRRDATDLGGVGNLEPFDFLFADPPYGQGLGEKAFAAAAKGGWLVPGALAILEERADVVVNAPSDYVLLEVRTFGDSKMHFFHYQPA